MQFSNGLIGCGGTGLKLWEAFELQSRRQKLPPLRVLDSLIKSGTEKLLVE